VAFRRSWGVPAGGERFEGGFGSHCSIQEGTRAVHSVGWSNLSRLVYRARDVGRRRWTRERRKEGTHVRCEICFREEPLQPRFFIDSLAEGRRRAGRESVSFGTTRKGKKERTRREGKKGKGSVRDETLLLCNGVEVLTGEG
jgi:hypothetical protein